MGCRGVFHVTDYQRSQSFYVEGPSLHPGPAGSESSGEAQKFECEHFYWSPIWETLRTLQCPFQG
jgi:hypothetical protein